MKPSSEELTKILKERIGNLFEVVSVDNCNFKVDGKPGHPFTIGPQHIAAANAGYNTGILDERVMEEVGCAFKGCNKPLSDHTNDTGLFVKLTRHSTNTEANENLAPVKDLLVKHNIGIAIIETPEKYRIDADTEVTSE